MAQTITAAMLTTIDNPYDPFTQYEEWDAYDQQMGYYSCSYLARVAYISDELSRADRAKIIEEAIDEIISYDVVGFYKKVTKQVTID